MRIVKNIDLKAFELLSDEWKEFIRDNAWQKVIEHKRDKKKSTISLPDDDRKFVIFNDFLTYDYETDTKFDPKTSDFYKEWGADIMDKEETEEVVKEKPKKWYSKKTKFIYWLILVIILGLIYMKFWTAEDVKTSTIIEKTPIQIMSDTRKANIDLIDSQLWIQDWLNNLRDTVEEKCKRDINEIDTKFQSSKQKVKELELENAEILKEQILLNNK